MMVRFFTARSRSPSSKSVGQAWGGPNDCTRIDAPSGTSSTASSAVAQTRFIAMRRHLPRGKVAAQLQSPLVFAESRW
jgi:hypothetical protein